MWPFSAHRPVDDDHETRIRKLESSARALSVDMEDLYDRVIRALRRVSKRAERAGDQAADEAPASARDTRIPEGVDDPVSLAIWERRLKRGGRNDVPLPR